MAKKSSLYATLTLIVLAVLIAGGYKIVQVKSKAPLKTLSEYDDAIMKEFGGSTMNVRPTSSVVRTIGE